MEINEENFEKVRSWDQKLKSTIQPVPVKREKVYYNDNAIVDEFASATAIRGLIKNKDFGGIRKVVPDETYKILRAEYDVGNVVFNLDTFEKQIIYNLRRMSIEQIANLPDVNEGLEHSIKNAAAFTNNLEDFMNIVKTKRYTATRIQRILICALLGITKKDVALSKRNIPYVRVLGFNLKGKELISRISKANPKLDIITSVKKFQNQNNNRAYNRLLNIDIFSTDVYSMACKNDYIANSDYTKNMIIQY